MRTLMATLRRVNEDESGHVEVGGPGLVGAIGAIILGIGATGSSDVVTIGGGVVLAVGIMGASLARHRLIDYDLWKRLDELEKK